MIVQYCTGYLKPGTWKSEVEGHDQAFIEHQALHLDEDQPWWKSHHTVGVWCWTSEDTEKTQLLAVVSNGEIVRV